MSSFNPIPTLHYHLAATQIYRWYQLYERELSEPRITNQMEILSEDVYMKSASGEMKGKENYPSRLEVYKGWSNAHHVGEIQVETLEEGLVNLKTQIHYQNERPDGTEISYVIDYDTELRLRDNDFPVFSKIQLELVEETKEKLFDAYPKNRLQSLIERLGEWLEGSPSMMKQTSHHPNEFKFEIVGVNEYVMEVEFDWYGITLEGKKMCAKTHHKWTVQDNINERFARISHMKVNVLEPFRILD